MLWHAAPRQSDDQVTADFLRAISEAWPLHVSKVSGRHIPRHDEPMALEDAKFFGITPRLPHIDVGDTH